MLKKKEAVSTFIYKTGRNSASNSIEGLEMTLHIVFKAAC
jgi:hypothetical protein